MANVRIGPDGSIIKDDVVVETEGRTIIREDGTIETTSVGRYSDTPNRATAFNSPPVSPLERNESRSTPVNIQPSGNSASPSSSGTHPRGSFNLRTIKEKEYDIQMIDGRIKNSIPRSMIIVTILMCILGAVGMYIFFIPALVTGIMIIVGFSKKKQLEAKRNQMYEELQAMKHGDH